MSRIAILGTGMGAFGAWYRLRSERHDVVLYDKNSYVGGHTYSHVSTTGFTFDEGPHVSFTKDERMRSILAEAVDGAVRRGAVRARQLLARPLEPASCADESPRAARQSS